VTNAHHDGDVSGDGEGHRDHGLGGVLQVVAQRVVVEVVDVAARSSIRFSVGNVRQTKDLNGLSADARMNKTSTGLTSQDRCGSVKHIAIVNRGGNY